MKREKSLKKPFSKRRPDTHKGNYGHVFVLAGSLGLTGAAALTSQSALLVGAGMVTLGIPWSLNDIMEIKLTEVMTRPLPETDACSLSLEASQEVLALQEKIDVFVIGPGLSQHSQTRKLIQKIIPEIKKPLVLDADGINALAGNLETLKLIKTELILTPHLGEFARLLGRSVTEVKNNRERLAKIFVNQYNLTLVLKGYQTLVLSSSGKEKIYINKTGNPGMATAGSGDVLTGMIGGLLAQGLNPLESAKWAVYLHGLAGDLAAKEKTQYCLIASDILENIPGALRSILNKG